MQLELPAGRAHLAWCTNIHAGESWPEILRSLELHVPAVRAALGCSEPLSVGLRLSGIAAAALGGPGAVKRFRAFLQANNAYVCTVNAFPYGPFHGTSVKANVYRPDWRTPVRREFTANVAAVLAELLPDGEVGSISTVPGAFKADVRGPIDLIAIVQGLLHSVADLAALEQRTGKLIRLALEPEPCCLLETVDETITFFEQQLASPEARGRLATLLGISIDAADAVLRRHLGVCYDVCHGAVEFEDPVHAIRRLRSAGIVVPKVQLSAALRIPDMRPDLLPALLRFDDGVYLHQVVAQTEAGLERYPDLAPAAAALRAGYARGEWRVHCHVPLFHPGEGDLLATRGELLATLHALRVDTTLPHLEVETYTWDVLPPALRGESKAADIACELRWVQAGLLPGSVSGCAA